jgi:signal transduction histidine kinase
VEIHTRVVYSRIVECEDGHPRGWPLLFVPHAPQYGQLQVQNTGSGIPAGACARKFEPLCTTKPGGAELGLYSVQEIVQAHGGGQVTVEDVERQGTRFTLTLPR